MAELMNRMQEGGDGELDDLLESTEEGLTDLSTWIRGLRKPEKPDVLQSHI
jgi:hypothetical protein